MGVSSNEWQCFVVIILSCSVVYFLFNCNTDYCVLVQLLLLILVCYCFPPNCCSLLSGSQYVSVGYDVITWPEKLRAQVVPDGFHWQSQSALGVCLQ